VDILVAQAYLLLFVQAQGQFYLGIILTPKELTRYGPAADSRIISSQKNTIIMTQFHHNKGRAALLS
jgi:hypothetical protein